VAVGEAEFKSEGTAVSKEELKIDIHAGNGVEITAGGRWTPVIISIVVLVVALIYGNTI